MEMINLIKKLAWNTFKNTGDINTFLELIEVENVEKSMGLDTHKDVTKGNTVNDKLIGVSNNIAYKNIIEAEKQNGFNESEGNSNSGEQYERL